jgi:hypothetical protein
MRAISCGSIAIAVFCTGVHAEYSESCSLYAQTLSSAASDYDFAKSAFKSACDPYYGYDKNDQSACGTYGYRTTTLKRAYNEVESALTSVALFCGSGSAREIALLAAKIRKLEAENAALRKAASQR